MTWPAFLLSGHVFLFRAQCRSKILQWQAFRLAIDIPHVVLSHMFDCDHPQMHVHYRLLSHSTQRSVPQSSLQTSATMNVDRPAHGFRLPCRIVKQSYLPTTRSSSSYVFLALASSHLLHKDNFIAIMAEFAGTFTFLLVES